LREGRILVCPTDTVYGLICDASNSRAVEKIFKIKNRSRTKPLPIFVKDIKMAKQLAFVGKKQERFLKESWPGAITVILKAKKKRLSELVYSSDTIGLRAPDYGLLNEVLKKIGKPLAQTSANISGRPAATKIKKVLEFIRTIGTSGFPILVVDAGDLPKNKPSKVVDLTGSSPRVLRD